MKSNITIYSWMLILIFLMSCEFPEHPKPNLHDYPTYFNGLESDILYYQDSIIVILDKDTQEQSVLNLNSFGKDITSLSWSPLGNSLFFIDMPIWGLFEDNQLYEYSLITNNLETVDNLMCFDYQISPDGEKILYSNNSGTYIYNLNTQTSINLNDKIAVSVNNESVSFEGIIWYDNSWLNNDIIDCRIWISKTENDSIVNYFPATVIIEYDNNILEIIKFESQSYPLKTYNSDSTYAYYKRNHGSEYDAGLFLIDYSNDDTLVILDKYPQKAWFTDDSRYLIYSDYTVYIEMFDASTKYWIYDVVNGTKYDIFPEAYDVGSVSISKSGAQILCQADFYADDYSTNIWVMNFDGSNPTLLSDPEFRNKTPRFRPIINER